MDSSFPRHDGQLSEQRRFLEPSILRRFDLEMRARPAAVAGQRIERDARIVRTVGAYNMILFSQLEAADVEATVAEQAEYFTRLGEDVEWKLYAHDRPAALSRVLAEQGFEPDEPETLMLLELESDALGGTINSDALRKTRTAADLEIRTVRMPADLAVYLAVTTRAFGKEPQSSADDLALRLFGHAPESLAMTAFLEGRAVAAGRLELPRERAFASLWGGGTDPELRGHGIYRELVRERAEVARARGYPYLTVDARESSRPILERLGFRALTTVTAWNLRATRSGGI